MNFTPNYSEIKLSNKDILYIVHYREHSTISLTNTFNSIGGTYSGVELSGYVEEVRGLLRVFPNFLEIVDVSPREELKELGFVEKEPTEIEKMLYK